MSTLKDGRGKNELTPKQECFCQEYLVDLNATAAAIRAGYSAKTAQEQASRLLSNVMVQAATQRLMDQRAQKVGITAEEVLREYRKLAFASLGNILRIQSDGTACFDLRSMTPDQAAAIQEFSVDEFIEGKQGAKGNGKGEKGARVKRMRIKLADKKGALDSVARHLGMFDDKINVTGISDLVDRLARGRERAGLSSAEHSAAKPNGAAAASK
jgi:phage terminase small subunit